MNQDEYICFNIGGKRYETCKSTILKYPNTLLATMLSDRNKEMLLKNSKGKLRCLSSKIEYGTEN